MYSPLLRVLLATIGFSPALIFLYAVKITKIYKNLSFHLQFHSLAQVSQNLWNIVETHYLIILFLLLVLVAYLIVLHAKKKLAMGRIQLKSVKPSDTNFVPVLFTVIPFIHKLYSPDTSDNIYILSVLIAGVIYGLTMKGSYHFNIILKLILGYNHYEVATTGDVTYLMLSKQKLANKDQVKQYVPLADHMLINMTPKT